MESPPSQDDPTPPTRKRSVVITGMGLVSCLGSDPEVFYDRLMRGESGITTLTRFPVEDLPVQFAGCVREYSPLDWLDRKQVRRLDACTAYGLVAAKAALWQARLRPEDLPHLRRERCGIILGSGMGGMNVFLQGAYTLQREGPQRVSPFTIPFSLMNMAGALLAIELGFHGPNYAISTACATSNSCFLAAAELIRSGACDLVIAGGAEAPIDPIGLAGFAACRAISRRNESPQTASRPWDQERDGFALSEGAGVLVLESEEHALARGAEPLARYLGGATNCDAYHFTEPHPNGQMVQRCIELALADAGVPPEEVDYINAHATSTPAGDPCELRAIRAIFSSSLDRLWINASKSMLGHCLGGAGALEAIAVIQALRKGALHPTINLEYPDPLLQGMRYSTEPVYSQNLNVALSNSFGFGGHNTTIVIGR